jgi:uncharacterized protein YbjT (DUF2867 family)
VLRGQGDADDQAHQVGEGDAFRYRAVAALGAEVVTGDLHDRGSVVKAAEGARAVFSAQMPVFSEDGVDYDGEVAQGANLIEGAKAAGVRQFVHTSVTGAGQRTAHPRWAEGRWAVEASFNAKTAIQDRVRSAGFPHWTLLKTGFFMENFLPSMAYLFPRGIEGGLAGILKPETRLSLTAVRDIGTAATAAFAAPERFNGVELELASDHLPMTEIAEILSRTLDTQISAPNMTLDEALAADGRLPRMDERGRATGPSGVRKGLRHSAHRLRRVGARPRAPLIGATIRDRSYPPSPAEARSALERPVRARARSAISGRPSWS